MLARELIELLAPKKSRTKMGYAISQGYAVTQQIYQEHEILKNEFGLQLLGYIQLISIQHILKTLADNNVFPGLSPSVSENAREYKFLELKNADGQSIVVARSNDPEIPGRYAKCREKRILTNFDSLFFEYDDNKRDEKKGFLLLCFGGQGFTPDFAKIGVPQMNGKRWHDAEPVLEKKYSSIKSDVTDIINPRKLAEEALEVIKGEIKKSAGSGNSSEDSRGT